MPLSPAPEALTRLGVAAYTRCPSAGVIKPTAQVGAEPLDDAASRVSPLPHGCGRPGGGNAGFEPLAGERALAGHVDFPPERAWVYSQHATFTTESQTSQ
jgi:hypothetical protein